MVVIRALLAAAICAAGTLYAAVSAQAETYPNRPIKVIVPFPPGGPTDGMARIISDRLGAQARGGGPDALAAVIKADTVKWAPIVAALGLKED